MPEHRVVVADDDPAMRSLLSWLLKEHGYEVTTVEGGIQLLEEFQQQQQMPDLVLLDIMMPKVDGVEVLQRLKRDPRWRDVPVLMVTALPPEEAAVKTLGLGAADFVRKPFRVGELLARIEAQLRARDALRAAREALRVTEEQLERARDGAERSSQLVDILRDITGQLSPPEIYRNLARRVAKELNVSRCSIILGRPGDRTGIVATAFEDPSQTGKEIDLDKYPELRLAIEQGVAVLVDDAQTSPIYSGVREAWEREGRPVPLRSAIALPFTLDEEHFGVLFLRSTDEEFAQEDVDFAGIVVNVALAAIRRAKVIELARADNARLEALSTTDPLTLLLNRRSLVDRLGTELERALRYGTALTLLLVDIDHFKGVNDTYGHLVGDDVLREVSSLLQHAVRTVDIVARFGGEEFVILLPETGREGGVAFAERTRERIESHLFGGAHGAAFRLTASVGVATFPDDKVSSSYDLFARADEALYRAKAEGRNRVCT
ncbi:MAG: GGDEF domain-containing response regulator [Gemmatimonadaceae bacterium]